MSSVLNSFSIFNDMGINNVANTVSSDLIIKFCHEANKHKNFSARYYCLDVEANSYDRHKLFKKKRIARLLKFLIFLFCVML